MNALNLWHAVLLCPVLLTGCSDELASQAKQAASQISDEAKKVASKKIEDVKSKTIEKINEVGQKPASSKESSAGQQDLSVSDEKGKPVTKQ